VGAELRRKADTWCPKPLLRLRGPIRYPKNSTFCYFTSLQFWRVGSPTEPTPATHISGIPDVLDHRKHFRGARCASSPALNCILGHGPGAGGSRVRGPHRILPMDAAQLVRCGSDPWGVWTVLCERFLLCRARSAQLQHHKCARSRSRT
jgi:hypothetical protein